MIFLNVKNRIATLTLFIMLGTHIFQTTRAEDDLLEDDLDALLHSISPEDLDKIRSCEPGEAAQWLALIGITGFATLFDTDFYKKTSIPIARNLINYPDFLICSYPNPSAKQLTTHVFYNSTPLKAFTQDNDNDVRREVGTRIGSYLNIENPALRQIFNRIITDLPIDLSPLKKIRFPNLLNTIANARLEERRLGLLWHYYQQITPFTFFEFKLPFFWMIRNLNFTQGEKQTITDELSSFMGTCVSEQEFAENHIIMDALGTGTLELSVCTHIFERENWGFDGGACVYLPTDHHWATGLFGTYIQPKDQQPLLDLCSLVKISKLELNPDAQTILAAYGLAVLDHLSSALLQCPLGYNQHVGAGLKLNPYWTIREDLEYKGQYILEFFLAQEEQRFFVQNLPEIPFSKSFEKLTVPDDEKLLIFEKELTKWLFPRVFTTKVLPGIIFNSTTCFQKTYRRWDFVIGYNAWYRLQERFICIQAPATIVRNLNIAKSINPTASMVKLFGKIHRDFHGPRHDLSFTFFGDIALFNQGVGNDYILGFSFDSKF
ncbi:MAG TPA: hypothetical protein VLG50_00770 [Candidatus Saccharimonadales bacterium]|nr:hypothetical protein [Candidatus Saccharimonadales bacterium]